MDEDKEYQGKNEGIVGLGKEEDEKRQRSLMGVEDNMLNRRGRSEIYARMMSPKLSISHSH